MSKSGKFRIEGGFLSNEVTLLCDAAIRGLGIALVPLIIARPFLQRGTLLHVLADTVGIEARIAVLYPERECVPSQVRAFVDAIAAWGPNEFNKAIPERCEKVAPKRGKMKRKT